MKGNWIYFPHPPLRNYDGTGMPIKAQRDLIDQWHLERAMRTGMCGRCGTIFDTNKASNAYVSGCAVCRAAVRP